MVIDKFNPVRMSYRLENRANGMGLCPDRSNLQHTIAQPLPQIVKNLKKLKRTIRLRILESGILALDQDDGDDIRRDQSPGELDCSRSVSFGDDCW